MKKYLLILLMLFLFSISSVQAKIIIPEKPVDGIYDPSHHVSSKVIDELRDHNALTDVKISVYIADENQEEDADTVLEAIKKDWNLNASDTDKDLFVAITSKDGQAKSAISDTLKNSISETMTESLAGMVRYRIEADNYDIAMTELIERVEHESQEPKRAEYISEIKDDLHDQDKFFLASDDYVLLLQLVVYFISMVVGQILIFIAPIIIISIIIFVLIGKTAKDAKTAQSIDRKDEIDEDTDKSSYSKKKKKSRRSLLKKLVTSTSHSNRKESK